MNQFPGAGANSGMHITKLLFVETGTYNDMTVRPYNTFVEAQDILGFQEASNGGRNLSPSALATVSNVLRPAAQHEGIVQIADGWNSRRLRFMMEVTQGGVMGAQVKQYLTGYTDHYGLSDQGFLDPNMRLIFNNTLTVRAVQEFQPGIGNINRMTVSDASHVINGQFSATFGSNQVGQRVMRPQDVFDTMGHTVLGTDDVMDLRTSFAGGIMKSRRNNGSASHYLSRTLGAYRQAYNDDTNNSNDLGALLGTAAGTVQEGLVSTDGFLAYLLRMQTTGLLESGSVTYGELCQFEPNLDQHITDVFPITPTYRATNYVHHAGDSENWTGNTMETVIATALSHSVPSIMTDMMLTGIHFRATNQTLDGTVSIVPMAAESFAEGVNLEPYIKHFVYRLEHEVLRALSRNNLIDYAIEVRIDILNDSMISVAMNGNQPVVYWNAQFADALNAPVITNNGATLGKMAYDIENLVNNMDTNYNVPQNGPSGDMSNGFSTSL